MLYPYKQNAFSPDFDTFRAGREILQLSADFNSSVVEFPAFSPLITWLLQADGSIVTLTSLLKSLLKIFLMLSLDLISPPLSL